MELRFNVLLVVWLLGGVAVIAQELSVERRADGVLVKDGQNDVLFYRTLPDSGLYSRAGYLHPLFGYDGGVLTEAAPEDHPYQHGIYWAWHQILLDDKPIANGWICENVDWKVKKVRTKKKEGALRLTAEVHWEVLLEGGVETNVVMENTAITIYPSQKNCRVIDLCISLKTPFENLKLGGADNEKGYGGLSLRLNNPDQISFFSKDGQLEPRETPVVAGPWMDFRKLSESGKFGVVVLVHPAGPNHGDQWILRNSTSMQNPVFPGREPVIIPKEGIELNYRLIVYGKDFDVSLIPSFFEAYMSH